MKKFAIVASMATLVLGASSCVGSMDTQTTFKSDEKLEAVNVKVQTVNAREVEQLEEFTANVTAEVVNEIAKFIPLNIVNEIFIS